MLMRRAMSRARSAAMERNDSGHKRAPSLRVPEGDRLLLRVDHAYRHAMDWEGILSARARATARGGDSGPRGPGSCDALSRMHEAAPPDTQPPVRTAFVALRSRQRITE